MRKLVVTADDFGLSLPVNDAVERAHREGILTATSLMVGAPAFEDAVERARRLPRLGVGLHLTLVDGRPVLPPEKVPHLVGPDGRFSKDPTRFGTALFFSSVMRHELEAEVAAQFERFRATELPMDHVNGHQHFHMHPATSRLVAKFAPAFGNPPVRIPVEPFGPSYAAARNRPVGRCLTWLFFLAQSRLLRRRALAAALPVNDFVFGLNDTGAMTETRVLEFLDELPEAISEFYFHPATARWSGPDNLPATYRPIDEFAALTSPRVKARLSALGVDPVPFRSAVNA